MVLTINYFLLLLFSIRHILIFDRSRPSIGRPDRKMRLIFKQYLFEIIQQILFDRSLHKEPTDCFASG